jgi:3'-5' exoribonuclease
MEIRTICGDQPVSGQYLIGENQLRTAKNGSSYLALKLGDATGELSAKVWDADAALFQQLAVGQVIELTRIQPKTYRDQIQLDWDAKNHDAFRMVPDSEVDFSRFLPGAPSDLGQCFDLLQKTRAQIGDPLLQRLLTIFFDDPEFVGLFSRMPAALKRHHAYIGGLLEHTAGVTALCRAAVDYYPYINRDLLLAGAMLHDIGKTRTYKLERGIEGSNEGKLIGHLVLGVEMVETALAELAGAFDAEAMTRARNGLVHLLVSHHGIMEWGSPVEPLTLEACILHHADNMDAQITKFLTIIRGEAANRSEWASFDPGLGRSVFLGILERDDHTGEATEVE